MCSECPTEWLIGPGKVQILIVSGSLASMGLACVGSLLGVRAADAGH